MADGPLGASSDQEGGKPRKRVITIARREQNRQAQRAYRTRQKQLKQDKRSRGNVPIQARPTPGFDSTPVDEELILPEGSLDYRDESFISANEIDLFDPVMSDLTWDISPPESLLEWSNPSETTTSVESNQLVASALHTRGLDLPSNTFFAALLQNGVMLGFDLDALASCRETYMSPLYKPVTPSSDLSTLSTDHSHLPVTLRPTPAQVMIPHHASFDLIPIPEFREQAIMLSAALPHMFNLKELKVDIHARGGLTIWQQAQRGGTGGHAWESKAWEAAPWFLKKWSLVVGGKDGILSRQSEKWQAVREMIGMT